MTGAEAYHPETLATDPPPTTPDYLVSPNAVFADQGVEWRYGKAPDYSRTRKAWKEGKQANHVAGSLEELVENLVKNWEIEASFKPRLQDWRTIDHQNYTFAMNGGSPQSAEYMLDVGTYNAIIEPNEYYSPENSDFASSHKTFKNMMPTFAWEVLEVYSGPPKVAFKWRHWGVMEKDYVGFNDKGEKVTAKAHRGPIEIFGVTVAQVDNQVRLQAVDTWMDPLAMFRQIAPQGIVNKEPMNYKVNKSHALEAYSHHSDSQTAHGHLQQNGAHVDVHALNRAAPQPVSEGSAEVGNGFSSQIGGCPFARYDVENSHLFQDAGAHPIDAKDVDDATEHNQSAIATPINSDRFLPESGLPASVGATVHFNGYEARNIIEAAKDQGTNGGIGKVAQESCDTLAVAGAEDSQTLSSESKRSAELASDEIANHETRGPDQDGAIHDSTEPFQSIGNVEGSEDVVNNAEYQATQDPIDLYLGSSAQQVHSSPKEIEHLVQPDAGEAVAASAESKETQKAHDEMSKVSPEESSLFMNRE